MTRIDVAALLHLAAEYRGEVGPCNRRCRDRGTCAFGRSEPPGHWCRERRPPRRDDLIRSDPGSGPDILQ